MILDGTATCEIGIPVERSPDSIRIRDRSRVTAIAKRTASLVAWLWGGISFIHGTVADPKVTCTSFFRSTSGRRGCRQGFRWAHAGSEAGTPSRRVRRTAHDLRVMLVPA